MSISLSCLLILLFLFQFSVFWPSSSHLQTQYKINGSLYKYIKIFIIAFKKQKIGIKKYNRQTRISSFVKTILIYINLKVFSFHEHTVDKKEKENTSHCSLEPEFCCCTIISPNLSLVTYKWKKDSSHLSSLLFFSPPGSVVSWF